MSDDTEKRTLSFAEVRRQHATVEGWEGWDALSRRLAGKVSDQGRDNIWIGVMLRRAAARYPGCLANFRSNPAWASLIRKQVVQKCDMGEPHYFEHGLDDFLRAGGNAMGSANPWSSYAPEYVYQG